MERGLIPRIIFLWITAAFAIRSGSAQEIGLYDKDKLKAATVNPANHRFNELYFTLRHNSYSISDDPAVWFTNGVRAAEIDILDFGQWQASQLGPPVCHGPAPSAGAQPLGIYLRKIRSWVDENPGEGPILLFIDLKTSLNPSDDWSGPEVAEIDNVVSNHLAPNLYTSDDLYSFASDEIFPRTKTLREAVAKSGWPRIAEMENRIVVVYTGGVFPRVNQTQARGLEYILAESGGRLPAGFFCPDVKNSDDIRPGRAVSGMTVATSQYIVSSNVKAADHYHVIANSADEFHQILHLWGNHVFHSDSFPYNFIAVAHGVSAIGRENGISKTFGGSIPARGVRRSLPGYFRIIPAFKPDHAITISNTEITNGANVHLAAINETPNQMFVYTAEGQLRPKSNNRFGLDVIGGVARDGAAIHLWDCDGGNSEKWAIDENVQFSNLSSDGQFLFIDGDPTNGNSVKSAGHSNNQTRLILGAVPGWSQVEF